MADLDPSSNPPGRRRPSRRAAWGIAAAAALAGVLAGAWPALGKGGSEAAPARPIGPPAHWAPAADTGYAIANQALVRNCAGCHRPDDQGRLGRISFMRKTPEGWQASIRRMVSLHGVNLQPEAAREIVRYLSNQQGLAPEELRPGFFEVERRTIEYTFPDTVTERTCNACHSMGRIITERRTREEWQLLVATHRALYPLADGQRFRRFGPPPRGATGAAADARHPMDRAIEHLARVYPLQTAEWAAWAANLRSPRIEGTWALSGFAPGRGDIYGTVTITQVPNAEDEYTTRVSFSAPGGPAVSRTGRSTVYTGYQWRGRSNGFTPDDELREVMFIERDWGQMSGRWFTGEYAELGMDVTLRRVGREAVVSGIHPRGLQTGAMGQEVRIYGANLPAQIAAGAIDFGPGVRVRSVTSAAPEMVVVQVDVARDAAIGRRDLHLAGVSRTDAAVVYDRVHALRVVPRVGMARVGGIAMPRQLVQFDAIAYHNGPDGRPGTADDLEIGRVDAHWSLEEYPVTFEDDDVRYVGQIDGNGFFTPNVDGPNPDRPGNRNNIGEVWAVATWSPTGAANGDRPLRARGHLLVTVPNYMIFDPWQVTQ